MTRRLLRALSAPLLATTVLVAPLAAQTITATIDGSAKGTPISPLIYGMFIEHGGSLLEQGFRAELLDDRKFYFAIGQKPPPRPGPFRLAARGWKAVGPADAVRMDSAPAYASIHAPRVTLASGEPRGIVQEAVALKGGVGTVGRIVVAGDPGAHVAVSLVWGPNAADRQTIQLAPLTSQWTTQRLKFAAHAASTDSARLEITGTGSGTFRVGAVSLMPADNVQGFRREVVTALAKLHSGVYRFPGGNFVSGPYDWRDAIGDPDRRAPRWDPVWSALQPNDFGLDEFMTLCGLLDVAPYITVNAGFGDAFSAAQEVEYANGAATTPMGRLRAANGHAKPYAIKYWGIGNEMWGDWQFGYMALDQWIAKQGQFARAMRRADPTILLVAPGAMPDAMTGSGMAKKLTGQAVAEPMGKADWSAALLSRSIDDFEILSQHFYVYGNTHYDLEQGKQVPDDSSLSFVLTVIVPLYVPGVPPAHVTTNARLAFAAIVALVGDTDSGGASPVIDDTTRFELPVLLTVSVVDALLGCVALSVSGPGAAGVEAYSGICGTAFTLQVRLNSTEDSLVSFVENVAVSLNEPVDALRQLIVNVCVAFGARFTGPAGVIVMTPPGVPSVTALIVSCAVPTFCTMTDVLTATFGFVVTSTGPGAAGVEANSGAAELVTSQLRL